MAAPEYFCGRALRGQSMPLGWGKHPKLYAIKWLVLSFFVRLKASGAGPPRGKMPSCPPMLLLARHLAQIKIRYLIDVHRRNPQLLRTDSIPHFFLEFVNS